MRGTRVRALRAELADELGRTPTKSEARAHRRGHDGPQTGTGHGERTYLPVKPTNRFFFKEKLRKLTGIRR